MNDITSPKILAIAQLGHPILATPTTEIADLDDPGTSAKITAIGSNMIATAQRLGLQGLAAPQVFTSFRMFAYTIHPTPLRPKVEYLPSVLVINPRILEESDDTDKMIEGCASIPGIYASVRRPTSITVECYILDCLVGTLIHTRKKLTGFSARVFLHECDHLDGVIFLSRVTDWGKACVESELQRSQDWFQ